MFKFEAQSWSKLQTLENQFALLLGRFVDPELPFSHEFKQREDTTNKRQQREPKRFFLQKEAFSGNKKANFDLFALGLLAFLWRKASNAKTIKQGFCFFYLVGVPQTRRNNKTTNNNNNNNNNNPKKTKSNRTKNTPKQTTTQNQQTNKNSLNMYVVFGVVFLWFMLLHKQLKQNNKTTKPQYNKTTNKQQKQQPKIKQTSAKGTTNVFIVFSLFLMIVLWRLLVWPHDLHFPLHSFFVPSLSCLIAFFCLFFLPSYPVFCCLFLWLEAKGGRERRKEGKHTRKKGKKDEHKMKETRKYRKQKKKKHEKGKRKKQKHGKTSFQFCFFWGGGSGATKQQQNKQQQQQHQQQQQQQNNNNNTNQNNNKINNKQNNNINNNTNNKTTTTTTTTTAPQTTTTTTTPQTTTTRTAQTQTPRQQQPNNRKPTTRQQQ